MNSVMGGNMSDKKHNRSSDNHKVVSPRPWKPEDFFKIKDSMSKIQHQRVQYDNGPWQDIYPTAYLGKEFMCKKCGYSFVQQFIEIGYFENNSPQDIVEKKMLAHLREFHIIEIVG